MYNVHFRSRIVGLVAGLAVLAFSGLAQADPPSRAARLGYISGQVSFSPAGEADWVSAMVNRPLTTGDRLWTNEQSRAEVQVGGAMFRMGANTAMTVLNLDDQITQLQLTQGVLNVRVRRLASGQLFEIATPNLAFTVREAGDYRIVVNGEGESTDIVVRRGRGDVFGEGTSYRIDSRQSYRFSGIGLRDYQYVSAPRQDEFDQWVVERDRGYENSVSARYVSYDVVGYQDLDANGTWRVDANYGNVWMPNRVASDWAPYREGHWTWVDPWGWTWIDNAPWGYAVSHYGRWANMSGQWGWVPGPVQSRAYYAPALVAFIGGDNFQLSISSGGGVGIGWFPLAPREVYRPTYRMSRGYYENLNRSNTVINNTVINNTYNTTNVTNVTYVNRQVAGAVTAVPRTTFVQSQQVAAAAVRVSREEAARAPVSLVAAVAPTEKSVRGAAAADSKAPPAQVFARPVVARTAPPAAPAGFAAQQQQLAAKPGQPLDADARKNLKAAARSEAPAVKVVTQTQQARPSKAPPAPANTQVATPAGTPAATPANEQAATPATRAIPSRDGTPATPAIAATPANPQRGATPATRAVPSRDGTPATPAIAATPPTRAQQQPGQAAQRGNSEQGSQRVAPAPRTAQPRADTSAQGTRVVPEAPAQRSPDAAVNPAPRQDESRQPQRREPATQRPPAPRTQQQRGDSERSAVEPREPVATQRAAAPGAQQRSLTPRPAASEPERQGNSRNRP